MNYLSIHRKIVIFLNGIFFCPVNDGTLFFCIHNVMKKKTNQSRRCKFIDCVVAEFHEINVQYINNLWSQTLLYNKSYLTNF
jgi:hypothetical protein